MSCVRVAQKEKSQQQGQQQPSAEGESPAKKRKVKEKEEVRHQHELAFAELAWFVAAQKPERARRAYSAFMIFARATQQYQGVWNPASQADYGVIGASPARVFG
jgi:hypothetical protein